MKNSLVAPERFERSENSAPSLSLANLDRMDLLAQFPYEQSGALPILPQLQLFDAQPQGPSLAVAETTSDVPACHSAYEQPDYGAVKSTKLLSDQSTETNYADGTVKLQYPYGASHIQGIDGTIADSDSGGNTSVTKPDGTDTIYDHCGTKTESDPDGTITTTFPDKSVATSNLKLGTNTIEYASKDVTVLDPHSNLVSQRTIEQESDGTVKEGVVTPTVDPSGHVEADVVSVYKEKPNGDLVLLGGTMIGNENFESDQVVLKRKVLDDGTKTYTSEDGSAQITKSPDKTFTLDAKFEDGEYRLLVHPDGSYEQSLPSGDKSRRLTDGTYEMDTPDDPQTKFTRVNPDGSVFYRYVDGSTETLHADGTATTSKNGVEEQRRITMTLENGEKAYPDFSEGEPFAKMPDGSKAQIVPVDNDHVKLVDPQGKDHAADMDEWSDARFIELAMATKTERSQVYLPQAMSELSSSDGR
jgi:hypothetical protein